jgi:hypothetical protein
MIAGVMSQEDAVVQNGGALAHGGDTFRGWKVRDVGSCARQSPGEWL